MELCNHGQANLHMRNACIRMQRVSTVPSIEFPFGINASERFVLLDKSFLQGVNLSDLQRYADEGWIFGVSEIFFFEHLRKHDRWRTANLFKLRSIESSAALLPGISEMFREEAKTNGPACAIMRARPIELEAQRGPSGEFFELDGPSLDSIERQTRDLRKKVSDLTDVWQTLRAIPELKQASHKEAPEVVERLAFKIRDDLEELRTSYANIRHPNLPSSTIIDKHWAYFRWIQVQLLAGLDFIKKFGADAKPNEENMLHELIDLDYLISALLVGGLACRETRIIERFQFLRSDGVILR